MKEIRLLIVDDHLLVRTGIKSLLSDLNEIKIVGEAENGISAVEKVQELKPDVVLMDISMPDISGIQATEIIKAKNKKVNILILTMHENEEYAISSIQKGASGVIHKNISKEELVKAVKTVASGERYFGSSLTQLLIEGLLQKIEDNKNSQEKRNIILTKREKQVLSLIANGYSNQEIGDKLGISSRTVDTYKTNLMQKLNIKSTAALARFAFENNLK